MHSQSSLRCRVTSAWHIEVEPPGCVVHLIYHIQGTDLLLCAYGRATTGAAKIAKTPAPAGQKDTAAEDVLGVLAVDSRDGTMMGRMSFLSTGEDESVVWLTASRRDKDETTVTCVTSAGSLWRFRLNTSLVTMSDAVHYDTLLEGLGSEASPMEDLVLAMGVEDHDRPATKGDGSGTSGAENGGRNGTTDGSKGSSSKTDANNPEFMSENGYRGVRSGYTYWDGTLGKAGDDTRQQHRAGYYRNDVMREILAEQRQRERAGESKATVGDLPPANRPQAPSQAPSQATTKKNKKKLLRCFLHLPATSKFVACAHQPEEGTITVGALTLGPECSVSNLDGLIGHMSGVLALAASPDEKYVASGSYDQTIRIYETASWTCLKVLKGHGGGIKCLAFSDDGTQLISAASDNTTRVWSTRTWMCMRQLHGRHEDATWPVSQAFVTHATEKLLLSGSNGLFGGSTLKIFDVASGDCLSTFAQLRFDQKGSCSAAGFASREDCDDDNGQQHKASLTAVTAATDASLAGWICEISREENKPLLARGFLCRA